VTLGVGGLGATDAFHGVAGALMGGVPFVWIWMVARSVVLLRATPKHGLVGDRAGEPLLNIGPPQGLRSTRTGCSPGCEETGCGRRCFLREGRSWDGTTRLFWKRPSNPVRSVPRRQIVLSGRATSMGPPTLRHRRSYCRSLSDLAASAASVRRLRTMSAAASCSLTSPTPWPAQCGRGSMSPVISAVGVDEA
jgi:hypothetical protein